jgi:superfamily II DNA or RNA helicase
MKEAALKESEKKQVVLATYSMAAEGLDIKSLTTLFMITPMTNIEQSVGRILRQKHEFSPIVVDIIDTHDNFQRQWAKRKSFFKKQNYKVIQTNSSTYSPDISNWRVINEPSVYKSDKLQNSKEIKKETLKPSSRSSSDRSIADDTESEDEEEEEEEEKEEEENVKEVKGVCLLKYKK